MEKLQNHTFVLKNLSKPPVEPSFIFILRHIVFIGFGISDAAGGHTLGMTSGLRSVPFATFERFLPVAFALGCVPRARVRFRVVVPVFGDASPPIIQAAIPFASGSCLVA